MRKIALVRGKIGLGIVVCVLLALPGLAHVDPTLANDVPGTISRVETDDRTVILEWTPLPGDTLTSDERRLIPQSTFVVPDLLGIDPSGFKRGDVVVGRGGLTSTPGGDLELIIGGSGDIFLEGQEVPRTYPGGFDVTGAFQFGRNYVAVAFSQPIDVETGTTAGNYSFSPSLSIESIRLQENGQIAILKTSPDLPLDVAHTVTVDGVSARDLVNSVNGGTASFRTLAAPVFNLAEIQAAPTSFDSVTVIGSVYIAVGNGNAVPSGYIQDGSRRGIRLAGETFQDAVNTVGNVVVVTGKIGRANFATWIEDYSSSVLAAGQPRLSPRILNVKDAKDGEFRGNFIQTQAELIRTSYDAGDQIRRFEVARSVASFAGYRVWRSQTPDPEDFVLLRTFSLLDSTWGYPVGAPRVFSDPDSIIPRGTEYDRLRDLDEEVPGPFNGFAYYYAVTWFDALLDPSTTPSRVEVFERTTIAEGIFPQIIYPSKKTQAARPLLGEVKVVPNPYNPDGEYNQQAFPGPPRVQFINLPANAKVDIYTMAGDYVRSLDHEEDDDSLDWDLKNNDDRDVAPGIYIYYIEASGETATGRFVIIR